MKRGLLALHNTNRVAPIAQMHSLFFELFGIAEYDRFDHAFDVLVWPDAEQYPLWSTATLGPYVNATLDGRTQHVVDPISVQNERRIWNVILSCGL